MVFRFEGEVRSSVYSSLTFYFIFRLTASLARKKRHRIIWLRVYILGSQAGMSVEEYKFPTRFVCSKLLERVSWLIS